ncbi:arginine--tRNA ligase [archaeon]|nr:arginine--tRNA ligase [archaeon]|tara:strand:+ start:1422 stop:3125 length:1704 start_codon:yes stop_codon:yes gene_type:complete
MNFKEELINLLSKTVKLDVPQMTQLLSIPPDPKLGDFAFPCFVLSKQWKMAPAAAAEKLNSELNLPKWINETKIVGPYLNFFIDNSVLAKETLTAVQKEKEKFGFGKGKKETIMIEFFHANTHKGVHIGHLRNISIGSALANILESAGYKTIRVNYQGDIGPHVAKCIWGYKKFAKELKEPTDDKGIWLGKLYSKVSIANKGDKSAEEEIRELTLKLYEHSDKEIEKLWKKTRQWCLEDFEVFYTDFGVKFDRLYFESEAELPGKKVFDELLAKKIAKESDGAIIVDLEKYKLNVYVGLTGKGYPTYQAKEMGLAKLKQKEFKFDKSLHVVGSEQELFFKQVFKTYELMKSPMAKKSTHISYGLVNLPEGKMSSRLGTMVLYADLFAKMMGRVRPEVQERHPKLSKKEVEKRTKMIAFAALKFSMQIKENNRRMTFDWERALDLQGDTGPYIQYAHARACSILRKAKWKKSVKVNFDLLGSDSEKKVLLLLSKYPEFVKESAEKYKPYLIAQYVLELAQLFSEFYVNNKVMVDDKELMNARLLLVDSVRQVLANGLSLLGISAPEEM